jgi:hypothetical protein
VTFHPTGVLDRVPYFVVPRRWEAGCMACGWTQTGDAEAKGEIHHAARTHAREHRGHAVMVEERRIVRYEVSP